jgi:lipopolysaccharide export system protein LptC
MPPAPGHIRRRQFADETARNGQYPNRGNGRKGAKLTSVHPGDMATRRGFTATSRGDAVEIYRAAMRHSRRVRWLRVGVPAVLAGGVLIVVLVNYLPLILGFRLSGEIGKLVIKGTKVTMQAPRMTGFTADSRPYVFTAKFAEQDITKPDLMELHQIDAKVEMEDKSTVNVTSNSGTYDMKTETLNLAENIHLVSSTGYEVRLSEAVIDVHKGNVASEKPVWVKLPNGFINAKRLEVLDGGGIIRFGGGVAMTVRPDQEATQASER